MDIFLIPQLLIFIIIHEHNKKEEQQNQVFTQTSKSIRNNIYNEFINEIRLKNNNNVNGVKLLRITLWRDAFQCNQRVIKEERKIPEGQSNS